MNAVTLPLNDMRGDHTLKAMTLAMLVEALLLSGLIVWASHTKSVPPPPPTVVKLTLVNEPTPPKPVVQPKPIPPTPKPVPRHVIQPKPVPTPLPPKIEPAPSKAQTPTAFTQPVPPPVVPPPTPPSDNLVNMKATYADEVRSAVQAAVYYPPAAALMHFSGRVHVQFHLLDKVPSNVQVITSSDLGSIDRAAIQAVMNAHYSTPPKALQGKELIYQVWVELTLKQ
jgi:protein TonB